MKKIASLTCVAALCLPAFALAEVPADLDTDADGVLTIDEVQASFPEVTSDGFSAMDLNADGVLDEDEVVAAQEAGLMPPTES
ncbi:hypothetical protein [Tateyamaria omphalii]|uniref:EF-hand domain-containing protein n=1 Tax=Tateyamaria omphalii TaxID=299262 RepID=A0A1P8N0B2_9RHOB|nr:hypothetical protein [Tateyamaria omphalii]APX13770.1 hypothetical protein BWR18_08220 [Tateyamaria omphalii]